MATLLKVFGAIWAVLGLGNIVFMPWGSSSEGIQLFGLMFNVLLFIVPGLLLYGLGTRMAENSSSQKTDPTVSTVQEPTSVEDRLQRLTDLKEKNLITDDEYVSRRNRILEDV